MRLFRGFFFVIEGLELKGIFNVTKSMLFPVLSESSFFLPRVLRVQAKSDRPACFHQTEMVGGVWVKIIRTKAYVPGGGGGEGRVGDGSFENFEFFF